jgi:adenylate kinase family enzyme
VRRVAVVGNSGSGKTTLARALAVRLGVPYVELDALNHLPGWQERDPEEFRQLVTDAVAGDGWVVDGNYRSRLGGLVYDAADTIVWLDYDRPLVMRRVVWRTLRRVVTREKLWNGNREPWSNLWSHDPYKSIIAWSWKHHAVVRERNEELMAAAPASQRWVRLRTPAQTDEWLAAVSPAAASS